MIENDIETLLEKVELLIKLVNELLNMTTPTERPYVINHHVLTDIEGAMRITGKAKPTIYANARKGIIPSYKRGNKLYFYEDELYKWIEGGKNSTATVAIQKRCSTILGSMFAICPVLSVDCQVYEQPKDCLLKNGHV